MGNTKAVGWIAGTVVLALLVMLGGWALLISPRLSSAADLQSETENQNARADQLRIQLAGLKDDFKHLDEFKADLAALQAQIPADYDLAGVTRQINDAALQSGVFIESIKPGMPTEASPVPAATPAAPAPAAGGGDAAGGAGSGTGGEAGSGTTTATTPGIGGLYAAQIEISVLGGALPTMSFLTRLQTGEARLLLVSSMTLTGQEPTAAAGGKPAILEGDAETVIKAYVYVLRDPGTQAPTDPAATGDATATNS